MEFEDVKTSPLLVDTLSPLGIELYATHVCDLRWAWSHAADSLWEMIDADAWAQTENPIVVLQRLTQERAQALANNSVFLEKLRLLESQRSDYMESPGWYGNTHQKADLKQIAYFSMEYGIGQALPLYAGGLGILAGDHLKTASDLGVPLVAVGLFYHEGYFRQSLDDTGWQQEVYPYNNPFNHPIKPVKTASGTLLYVLVELPGRTVRFRVWQANVGKITLYLLDSNEPLNSPIDRCITSKLYGGGHELRLIQEMALGVGGWRLIDALNLDVDVCHLNEGHAAFVTLERARDFMQKNQLSFNEALWATRVGNVFTTHTPVAAGFDTFHPDLMTKYGLDFAKSVDMDPLSLMGLGRRNSSDATEPFNMALLAARTCCSINGVSQLHGSVSRHIFADLYPRWPVHEVPVNYITNGVHVPSWDSPWADAIWTDACGKDRWMGTLEGLSQSLEKVSDEALWGFRGQERSDLIKKVRTRLTRQLGQRGELPERIDQAGSVLDSNTLTLGFARRFAEYKRPNLLLQDGARFLQLLTNSSHPVQIVIAGKAHPQDTIGKRYIQEWMQFVVSHPEVRDRVVFVEDYDIKLAQELVQGVDVWINTPRRPWEASGTSGMKVLVNGGLNLSSLDGWWAEAYSKQVGWSLGDGKVHTNPQWDTIDATQLYDRLEQEIVPEFYKRDARGIPREWVSRIRTSMTQLAPQFSTNRMVREYVEKLYLPAATAFKSRTEKNCQIARDLDRWRLTIQCAWDDIRFGEMTTRQLIKDGQIRGFSATVSVFLGGLSPDDVQVQLYADPGDEVAVEKREGLCTMVMARIENISDLADGFSFEADVLTNRPATDFTPRVVPYHSDAYVPMESHQILWKS